MNQPPSMRAVAGLGAEEILAALPAAGPALLYKHSFRCGISLTAREELEEFALARPDVPILQLDVMAQRPASQTLATLLRIPHASPQVILFRDRVPVWSATHSRITTAALLAAVGTDPGESTGRRAS